MRTLQLSSVLLSALALATAACGGPPSTEAEASSPQADETLSLTSVTWDERGVPEVNVRRITSQEQQALAAARLGLPSDGAVGVRRQALSVDAGCTNPSSMWLYDRAGQTGNMLCLLPNRSLSDSANLNSYFRAVLGTCPLCYNGYWGRAVKSYWTPVYNAAITPVGGFFQGPGTSPCYSYWRMDGQRYEANACAQSANILGTYDIH